MSLFVSFFFALLLSTILTPPLIRVADRIGLVDKPEPRKVHDIPIPRCGGIAIALGAALPVVIWMRGFDPQLLGLAAGGAIIFVFGLMDDRWDLHYAWKLVGQILAALVAVKSGIVVEYLPFVGIDPVPAWIAYPLTVVFIVGVTNAINFSDGLDGLAAGTSLIALGAIAWLAFQSASLDLTLVALAVMGAILGFLRYNTHPAMVFMGDAGSQFLGFVTTAAAIVLTQTAHQALSPAVLFLLLGLPLLDAVTVIIWRLRNGKSPFKADRTHFHHRLLNLGFAHYEAVSIIYLAQTMLVGLAILFRYEADALLVGIYVAFAGATWGFFRWARVRASRKEPTTPAEQISLFNRYPWVPNASVRATEFAVALFILAAPFIPQVVARDFGALSAIAAVALGLALLLEPLRSGPLRRLPVYVAAVFAVYALVSSSPAVWAPDWRINAFLGFIAILLVLAIRVNRRDLFRVTPQDLLVVVLLVVVTAASLFTEGSELQYKVTNIAIRLAVLLYAIEFLYSVSGRRDVLLRGASIVSLLALGMRGMLA